MKLGRGPWEERGRRRDKGVGEKWGQEGNLGKKKARGRGANKKGCREKGLRRHTLVGGKLETGPEEWWEQGGKRKFGDMVYAKEEYNVLCCMLITLFKVCNKLNYFKTGIF